MSTAQVLLAVVVRFLVGVDRRLILVQVLVLDGDVVQCDYNHSLAGLKLIRLLGFCKYEHLVLNQN